MQQLREKDDANFKLVSERIKLENVQKILKEEKEIYAQQVWFDFFLSRVLLAESLGQCFPVF